MNFKLYYRVKLFSTRMIKSNADYTKRVYIVVLIIV